jgi:hypothetical protein
MSSQRLRSVGSCLTKGLAGLCVGKFGSVTAGTFSLCNLFVLTETSSAVLAASSYHVASGPLLKTSSTFLSKSSKNLAFLLAFV